ncbi:MAG: hypothetical protein FJ087_09000 [Deltaproteobacteria bacterium]|nr:hypothetical protein [Deltaproteobacteria bacterium]
MVVALTSLAAGCGAWQPVSELPSPDPYMSQNATGACMRNCERAYPRTPDVAGRDFNERARERCLRYCR